MKFSTLAAMSVIALGSLAGSGVAASAQTAADGTYIPAHRSEMRGDRPLTVKRHRAPAPVIIEAPVVAAMPFYGPGVIVTGPLHIASSIVGLPFQALGHVFPASGSIGASPLVLIGAPIAAAGQIAQFPFRVVDSAFGAPYPGTAPVLFQ